MNEYIVEMENINKSFSGVPVLKNVRFTLKAGEVMALLGENGAGKSTLMKILSGVYVRDSGTMKIFGEEQGDLDTKKAQELGVAIIHQELNMCRHLTVAENIFLGREVRKGVTLNNREMVKRTQEVLDSLKIDLNPNTVVGDLPVSKQQMVEIAKALSVHAKILIMDEPTSALSSKEIDELFRLVDQLRSEGCGIVYISHRMEELSHVANRVTVMRDGEFIMEGNFADYTMDQLIAKMVGRDIKEKFPRVQCQRGEKILEVKNLNAGRMVRDVSFDLYAGEIVGIAGLVGAGRTETTRAIFGIDPKDSGEIVLDGKSVSIKKPIDAIKAGIVLTPEDRKRDGLCTKLGVRENLSIPNLDWLSNGIGKVNQKKEREIADKVVEELQIKLSSVEINAESLSGGNQQKVVIGKWLARNSRVIMFDEPTRGVDVGAKVEIYNLMNRLKQQGTGVLFVSSELPEILGISDRILVMCDGHLTGELPVAEATEDKILSYATAFESKI
ncbi:sugar ABC transporter ATP-binding protein [Oscillibacter valericigenes]|uniref:sugar ABC transporter ATP-binding protein n=1 Tax=Oscillibacter ruminantium TaxID=1263547 RepID=UPI0025AA9D0D|nr:sugar ABC transporter ATP-binding protein [Oscillibacter valericigenes]